MGPEMEMNMKPRTEASEDGASEVAMAIWTRSLVGRLIAHTTQQLLAHLGCPLVSAPACPSSGLGPG